MAASALVREQIEGGEKLIRKLLERGSLRVDGALWGQREYDGRSYLYLVLPNLDRDGSFKSHEAIGEAQAELENEGIHWMERIESLRLLPPTDSLARGLLEKYRNFPKLKPSLPRDQPIGSEFVENAFIYPPSVFQPLAAATP